MSAIIARIKSEPAVVIGIVAAAILAALQSLAGNGVISQDAFSTLQHALDPNGGWVIPIIVAIITRFFVSPASRVGV